MNQRAILLVCTVLAATGSLATYYTDYIEYEHKYLNWTRVSESNRNRAYTLEFLRNVGVLSGERPHTTLSRIRAAVDNSPTSEIPAVFLDLISLADPTKPCTDDVILRVLEISSIMRESTQGWMLNSYLNFLKHYGSLKFGRCSWDFVQQLEDSSDENQQAEMNLAGFFNLFIMTDHEGKHWEKKALKSLNFLDLSESTINMAAGLDYILPLYMDLERWPGDVFFKFFDEQCDYLMRGRQQAMDIITLADAFEYTPKSRDYPRKDRDSQKVQRLKEYYRLCLSLQRADMREYARSQLMSRIINIYNE